jgi:hypothetical protein
VPAKSSLLFCPRCRKPRSPRDESGKAACEDCGEGLIAQGYCPVCEEFWPLAVGALCPKHDVELVAGPPPRPEFDAKGQPVRWVTVARFADALAAHAPRIRLEDEGIPTFLEGERMGSRSMYSVATGGAKLKVPDHLAADARVLLSQTWSSTAAALDIEELPEDEPDEAEELLPGPGRELPSLGSSLLVFLLVGLPSVLLLFWLLRSMSNRP